MPRSRAPHLLRDGVILVSTALQLLKLGDSP
jgi:hypothetical protein